VGLWPILWAVWWTACTAPPSDPTWAEAPSLYEVRLYGERIGTERRWEAPDASRELRRRELVYVVGGVAQRVEHELSLEVGPTGRRVRRLDGGPPEEVGRWFDDPTLPPGRAQVWDPWGSGPLQVVVEVDDDGVRHLSGGVEAVVAEGRSEAWGLSVVRVDGYREQEPVDLDELLSVPVVGTFTVAPRRARVARWRVGPTEHALSTPLVGELVKVPFGPAGLETPDDEVARFAREATQGAHTTWEAHRALVVAVERAVRHRPVPQGTTASQTLRRGVGDCTERAALYVAAARAVGLEARQVAGGLLDEGRLRPHAWAEARIGERWVAVDPSLAQAPADAARLPLPGDAATAARRLRETGSVELLDLR
jgi:transglutaminase-like putative cysteine protease